MRISFPTLFLVLGALLFLACPETPVGSPCAAVSDCSTGKLCKSEVCVVCESASDCSSAYGDGAKCTSGTCVAASCVDGQLTCACIDGDRCDQGECVNAICVDCQRGAQDCVCLNNGSCDQGQRCNGDSLCEICPDGELNCACDPDDRCDDPQVCVSGICTTDPCPVGSQGCPCDTDDLCDGDLYCDANTLCAVCSSDVEGCPCDSDQTCQNDLVCENADTTCRIPVACTDLACVAHQQCQERQPGVDARCLESCDSGYRWDAGSTSCGEQNCLSSDPLSIADDCSNAQRSCVPQTLGGAICGGCLVGFTDESGVLQDCRAFFACADLDCAAQQRHCIEGDTSKDAICDTCLDGYVEGRAGCVESNCGSGDGSIVSTCTAEHRDCVDPVDAPAHCGSCVTGYSEDNAQNCQQERSCDADDLDCAGKNRLCDGTPPLLSCGACIEGTAVDQTQPERCVAPLTCADLTCGNDFCLEGDSFNSAVCVPTQCAPNQAYNKARSECVTCVVSCNDSDIGETGRIWPFTKSGSNICICETEPNYYWDEGEISAKPCDADGDGWVRASARSSVESSDETLRQNARCSVHTIDRFVLRNELGQRKTILLCTGSPSLTDDPSACAAHAPIHLYETWRNDDQNEIDQDFNVPAYQQGGVGRRLRAVELNSLTKACVNEGGDYNHNGRADMAEWHGRDPAGLSADEAIFAEFSYYIELHRSWYESRSDSALLGQYVVAERSRCDADFPLGYADGSDAYWRDCTRSRDASYDATDGQNGPEFGLDFARWSCDTEFGSCPIPPPPTEVLASGVIPKHNLCRADPLPAHEAECDMSGGPWPCVDGQVWRGMSHHSQFRCVKLRDNPGTDLPTLPASAFTNGGDYDLNVCRVDCPSGDINCNTDCTSGTCVTTTEAASTGGQDPGSAVLHCEIASSPASNQIGFASVRYKRVAGLYQRGCIDEWSPTIGGDPVNNPEIAAWRSLCPGWAADPTGSIGQGIESQFGLLACGCGVNYGGPDCDIGCPDAQLSVSAGYEFTPRVGYWMCADFSSTGYETQDPTYGPALVGHDGNSSTYILRDDIGPPVDGTPLCEDSSDCSSGYVIR